MNVNNLLIINIVKILPSLSLILNTLIISLFLINSSLILAQNNWQKFGSPVLNLGPPGSWDSAHVAYQYVLGDLGSYKMWYAGSGDGSHWRIGYATSQDGINWDKNPTPVVDTVSQGFNSYGPTVLRKDGLYRMWYVSRNLYTSVPTINYTTSQDGISWETPITVISSEQAWENGVEDPNVIFTDGVYKIYYQANQDDKWKIGYATSADGVSWIKYANNPIFEPDPSETPTVGGPSVIFDGTKYIMFYHSNHPPRNIHYATSVNGITEWSRSLNNPIFTSTSGSFDNSMSVTPSVIAETNSYKLWYSGFDGSNWRIGYASASADISPTQTPTPIPTPPSDSPTAPNNQSRRSPRFWGELESDGAPELWAYRRWRVDA